MNWIYTSSSFKYNGIPVTRRAAICKTILGEFKVFEAVSGSCWIINPFVKSNYTSNIPGYGNFNNGLEEWFGKSRARCSSFERGVEISEEILNKVKEIINKY